MTGAVYPLDRDTKVPAEEIGASVGNRIKGTSQAKGRKMQSANGGGRFIEPVYGAPRIVAGVVLAVDDESRTVLVDVAIPMRVALSDNQDLNVCQVGELVNFYVESGTSFTPV